MRKMKIHDNKDTIKVKTKDSKDIVSVNWQGGIANVGVYHGVYEVTPLPYASQELLTANKKLERNVLIHEIPYAEVSNDKGGLTATIGE